MKRNTYGFTIVELLIVIVVIAILASIAIVSYVGVQDRATNTATINAAKQTADMVRAYIALEGRYPSSNGSAYVCVTHESGCATPTEFPGRSDVFEADMSQIGELPRVAPVLGSNRYGVFYQNSPIRTVNGQVRPVIIIYYLKGTEQSCGLPEVVEYVNNTGSPFDDVILRSSTTGYTHANAAGKTVCYASIPSI